MMTILTILSAQYNITINFPYVHPKCKEKYTTYTYEKKIHSITTN